jgi:hypothetical protein
MLTRKCIMLALLCGLIIGSSTLRSYTTLIVGLSTGMVGCVVLSYIHLKIPGIYSSKTIAGNRLQVSILLFSPDLYWLCKEFPGRETCANCKRLIFQELRFVICQLNIRTIPLEKLHSDTREATPV